MNKDRFDKLYAEWTALQAAGDPAGAALKMLRAVTGYDQFVFLARTPEGGLAAYVEGDGIWAIGAMEYHQRQMIAWNLRSAADRVEEAKKAQFELSLAVGPDLDGHSPSCPGRPGIKGFCEPPCPMYKAPEAGIPPKPS